MWCQKEAKRNNPQNAICFGDKTLVYAMLQITIHILLFAHNKL
jgi:hypothetical protein